MLKVGRFILVVVVALVAITFLGHIISDFDMPPEYDPYDLWRGLGVWATAILIAVLDVLLCRRRNRGP